MTEERNALLGRAQAGDRDALQALLAGQQERLYLLCLGWSRNRADAEDLVQETLLRACACLSQLQDAAALSPWLTRIAQNLFRNWLVREKPKTQPLEVLEWEGAAAEQTGEATLDRMAVEAALASLPPELRLAIRLFYLHGMTQKELASLWQLPESTIKGRLDSGRQRMRKELEQMGVVTTNEETGAEITLPKTRVALTDADPAATKAQRAALRKYDFQVSVVSSEELLLQRLQRQVPDILIMNTPFGTLEENDALRAIRLDPRLRHIAVMFVVPKARLTDARLFQAWELGVDCFLTDPMNGTEIVDFVRRMDASRRADDYKTLAIEYAWRRDSPRTLLCLKKALELGGKKIVEAVQDDPAFNYLRPTDAFQLLFA